MSKTGIELIAEERQRQVEKEGWTPEHDDEHDQYELSTVAACYAVDNTNARVIDVEGFIEGRGLFVGADAWPDSWDPSWDKRRKHKRLRRLAIAGALIAAEIDRIQRKP